MIQQTQRPLTSDERQRLLAPADTGLQQLAPVVLAGMVGLIFAFALAPVFSFFGLPRALAFGVAGVVALGWWSLSRRRQARSAEARRRAAEESVAERVTLTSTRALGIVDASSARLGLLLDCGEGELAYVALAAFPTNRPEWRAGDRYPERFTLEWVPHTGDVLASRADGEARPISGSVPCSSLPITEETRFARLRRDQLEPQELLLLQATEPK